MRRKAASVGALVIALAILALDTFVLTMITSGIDSLGGGARIGAVVFAVIATVVALVIGRRASRHPREHA
jgi:membrane protein implicated in regulation of membrane protease activity